MSSPAVIEVGQLRPGEAQQIRAAEACPVCQGDVMIERSPIAPDSEEERQYFETECVWWAWEGDRGSCLACKEQLVVRTDGESAWLEPVDGSEP